MTVHYKITADPDATDDGWIALDDPMTIRYGPADPDNAISECNRVRVLTSDSEVPALEAVKALRRLVDLHDGLRLESYTPTNQREAAEAWQRARVVLGRPEVPTYSIPTVGVPGEADVPLSTGGDGSTVKSEAERFGDRSIYSPNQTGGFNFNVTGDGNTIDGRRV